VKTKHELYQWAQTAGQTFELNTHDLIEFFKPLIDIGRDIPYLAYYNDEPAATSLVYCSNETAGIYAMSTLAKFRRKGLGIAAVNACLEIAKNKQMKNVVLYASAIGEFLYKNVGFKTVHVLNEYFYIPTQQMHRE
jgi:GNAT superfamily N-acetyltransferase